MGSLFSDQLAAFFGSAEVPTTKASCDLFGTDAWAWKVGFGAAAVVLVATIIAVILAFGRSALERAYDAAFDEVDVDGTGTVTNDELYAGVLLVYIKVNAVIRVLCALAPPPRSDLAKIFKDIDDDKSGDLDRNEFKRAMRYLSRDVVARVCWTAALTVAAPIVAPIAVDACAPHVAPYLAIVEEKKKAFLAPCPTAALNATAPYATRDTAVVATAVLFLNVALPIGLNGIMALTRKSTKYHKKRIAEKNNE